MVTAVFSSSFEMVDQIVVSVGPYMFQTEADFCTNCDASFCETASPPIRILSPRSPVQPASSSMRHVAGVACITVARDWESRANN